MAKLISVRGDSSWRGRSTRSLVDRGAKYQRRIVNGYVSGDGGEVRTFPGWRTLIDLTFENNPDNGFRRLVFDSVKPTTSESGGYYYDEQITALSGTTLTQKSTAKEAHVYAFEQVRGNVCIIGESMHSKTPIYTSSRVAITVTGVSFTADLNLRIETSGSAGSPSASDLGTGMYGIYERDVITVEDIELDPADATMQALIDGYVNDRFHVVKSISSGFIIVRTTPPGATASGAVFTATGKIYRTRNNASGVYPTPNPITPYEPSVYHQIEDQRCLTTWTVREPLAFSTAAHRKCTPAWVANRMLDGGEAMETRNGRRAVLLPGESPSSFTSLSWSRRRQRRLPYRVNPDVAGDRIVMAAPGYLCCFQAPMMVPLEAEDWPSQPSSWTRTSGRGVTWFGNDIYDRPRCLGVPKAILLDSLAKNPFSPTSASTPAPANSRYNFLTYLVTSPIGSLANGVEVQSSGFAAGTYKVAISYVDEVTGEEGLASEPVEITITAGLGMQLAIMHPGYVMPESLCRRVNIYVAPPGTDALGFYTSILLSNTSGIVTPALVDWSSKYGVRGNLSPDVAELWTYVPLPLRASPMESAIDYSRLAPQSGQQPRGAEAIRFIQGILFTVGHGGTHGNSGELLLSTMSANFTTPNGSLSYGCFSPNEVQVRAFRSELVAQSTPADADAATANDGGFGVGGNRIPASYQGCEVYTKDLIPAPANTFIIDAVKNNASVMESFVLSRDIAMWQRLRTVNDIRPRVNAPQQLRQGKDVYLKLPRGQVQYGDPGRTGAVSATSIQFLDAKKDDDGFAIGQLGNSAVLCSRDETYLLSWFRTPAGSTPTLVSMEHGCIATNSMVTFDGGCAWIGKRGPVAMSSGTTPTWVGEQIEDDFHHDSARYVTDSKGVSRCTWGAHDAQRGLVLWGMVTSDSTHQMEYEGVTATYANHSDQARSRFPCNEILVWSYRANAFSTWVPPAGLEVLWMRPLQLGDGTTRMCFLAADKRIYALDDEWADTNESCFSTSPAGEKVTTSFISVTPFTIDGTDGGVGRETGSLLRLGMPITFIRDGQVVFETTVSTLDAPFQTIGLTSEFAWESTDTIEIGRRPTMTIETSYIGESDDTMRVDSAILRYTTVGTGNAFATMSIRSSNMVDTTENDDEMMTTGSYVPLLPGSPTTQFARLGQRRAFEQGHGDGGEIMVSVQIQGNAGVRITDIVLSATG